MRAGFNCRIKLFVDSLRKDVSRLTLTTTYYLQGHIVCEVEKGINYVITVLSTVYMAIF